MRTATDGSTGSNKGRAVNGHRLRKVGSGGDWSLGSRLNQTCPSTDSGIEENKGLGMCGERVNRASATIGPRPFRAFPRVSDQTRYQPARAERPKIPSPNTASKDRALHPSSDDTRFFQRAWQVTKNQPRNPRSAFASKLLRLFPDPELVPRRLILPAGASADLQHLPILRGEGLSPRVRADCTLRP